MTEDRPDVRPLDARLLREHLGEVLRVESAAREELGDAYSHERWGAEHFLAERPKKWALSRSAFRDGRLTGFVIASRDGHAMHVHRVAVERSARGTGGPLMAASEAAAHDLGLDRVVLSVAAANPRAIGFYRRRGYRPLEGADLERYARSRNLTARDDHLVVAGRRYLILAKPIRNE